ncbi:SPW repeat domain-containing protein [Halopiger aswanensis]|uniref:SPW repeat-containing integral membrane domain-containing protein n=1 Tax=Halopiger aswanensis TaxID=148449 RepID=A0A419W0M1_9EURY|nr:hypothetical protein [Halopiger aswanensis]RKD89018.1 hypothetical protein ATJ93_3839 [Halopiger aswanensis]
MVFGLWVIAAPLVLGAPTAFRWTVAVTGILIGTLSSSVHWLERGDWAIVRTVAGMTTILGVWLLTTPFLFRVGGLHRWNAVCVGVLVASLAGYNYYLAGRLHDGGSPAEPNTNGP